MTQSQLLNLPGELRRMIWRELLCPPKSIPLQIDYSYLHKVHLLEEVLGGAKVEETASNQEYFLPPRSGAKIPPPLPSPLPEGQSSISRPALEARLAPLWILLVSKQINTECSAIYRQGNAFNIRINMDLMSRALGWDYMGFLFSSNTSIRFRSVTVHDIPRHDEHKEGFHHYWTYYPLTKILLPLLLHSKFIDLRLQYNRQDLWDGNEDGNDSVGDEDGNDSVGEIDVPLDAQDIQKIEYLRDNLKGHVDFEMQCWVIVEDNSTEEILVLSRPDESSKIPIPKDSMGRRGL